MSAPNRSSARRTVLPAEAAIEGDAFSLSGERPDDGGEIAVLGEFATGVR